MDSDVRKRLNWIAAIGASLLGLLAPPAMAASGLNDPADVKSIADIENAIAVQTDMRTLIGNYAPNAFVEDMLSPGIYQGRTEIQKNFTRQLSAVKSMTSNVQDLNIVSDGNLACAVTRVGFGMTMKNGASFPAVTRQLDAFKKIDGKWQITQEQISVPTDRATGMALLDANAPERGAMTWSSNMFSDYPITSTIADAEIKAWLITGAPVIDINEMVSHMGPGQQVLMYDKNTSSEYRGVSEIHDAYAPLLSKLSSVKVELPHFVVDSDGQFGIQIDTQNLKLNFKDGKSKVISFRQSDCLHRVGGKWYSFFEMRSYPFDPQTGRAVTLNQDAFQP